MSDFPKPTPETYNQILLIIVRTLCGILALSTAALILGLWFDKIDNGEIFKILGTIIGNTSSSFNTIIGGLAVYQMMKK